MADRNTKVSLTASVGSYLSGFEQATSATKKFSEQGQAALEQQKAAMERLGTASIAFGAVAAAAVGLAVSKYAEFDAAMSSVQAATHESAANMDLLRNAAIQAGASTVFTATEAANAIEELAKAGVSTADIMGGALAGSLDLASAGELGVAEAAEIAATAMTQFKLEGSDVPHIADLLAAAAGKAQGSVQDMAGALNQAGLVASQTGLSIEETTGGLAAFASAGLTGSDAGTSFKSMLQRLTPQSAEAASKMDELGISAYDAQGNFIGLEAFAQNLQDSLKGLTTEQRNAAMATIFGSDAVRASAVLYEQGAEGIGDWIANVDDSGYAAETARIKLDNLNGDVEKLGGAFDTLLIKSGSAADGLARGFVQALTELLDMFNDAPLFVQQTALALGAVAAAVALAGGAFLVGVPQVAAFNAALVTLSTSTMPGVAAGSTLIMGATARAATMLAATAKFLTGPWGLALAAATVGVMALSDVLKNLQASSEEITNSLKTASSATEIFNVALQGKGASYFRDAKNDLADLDKVLAASAEQSGNLFARFDTTYFPAFDALRDVGEQLSEMASTDLPAAQNAFRLLVAETDGSEQSQWRLLNATEGYKEALVDQANQLGINVTSSDEAANKTALLELAFGTAGDTALDTADSYLEAQDQTDALSESISKLLDSFNELNGVNQDAVSANAQWQESLAGITDQVDAQKEAFIALQSDAYEAANGTLEGFVGTLDGFSLSLDRNTASGASNADSLSQVARDAQAAALAQYEVDKTTMGAQSATDKYIGTLGTSRQALIDGATAAGYNADEVNGLANEVFALPDAKQTQILAETSTASNKLSAFGQQLDGLPSVKNVAVNVAISGAAAAIDAFAKGNENGGLYVNGVQAFANGGFPTGIYAGRQGGIHKFAEENVGWEAYVSGKPGQEARNRGILMDAASRLGMGSLVPAGGSANVSVQLSSRGGVDLLKYVDVRVNGALVGQERNTMLEQLGG
jgi:TP901 family phage tail tape measure protein